MSEKISRIRIGDRLIGLKGLEDIFAEIQSYTWESPAAAQDELLRRVARNNYVPDGVRAAYHEALWREYRRFLGEEATGASGPGQGLEIAVLGLGCFGCQQFYQQVVDLVARLGLAADLEYSTDPAELARRQVRTAPALLVNGRVVVAGRIPLAAELEQILREAGRGATPGVS
jgi:hypothetical protein